MEVDATGKEQWSGTATTQSRLPHSPVSGFRPAHRLVKKDLEPWSFLCSGRRAGFNALNSSFYFKPLHISHIRLKFKSSK